MGDEAWFREQTQTRHVPITGTKLKEDRTTPGFQRLFHPFPQIPSSQATIGVVDIIMTAMN